MWRWAGGGGGKTPPVIRGCVHILSITSRSSSDAFFFFEWESSARLFYTVDNLGTCFCYLSGCFLFFFFHVEIVCKTFVLFASPISHPKNTQPILLVENSIQSPPSFSSSLPSFSPPSPLQTFLWMCAVWQALGSVQRNKNHQVVFSLLYILIGKRYKIENNVHKCTSITAMQAKPRML